MGFNGFHHFQRGQADTISRHIHQGIGPTRTHIDHDIQALVDSPVKIFCLIGVACMQFVDQVMLFMKGDMGSFENALIANPHIGRVKYIRAIQVQVSVVHSAQSADLMFQLCVKR
jgi:hypothetical protein